jgi:hypothetical protein
MKRLVAAAALVLALPASAAPGASGRRYFPLRLGNSWTFQSGHSSGRLVMKVVGQSGGTFRLSGFPGTERLAVRWAGETLDAWDGHDRRWEPLLRFGARAGTSYAVDLGQLSLWSNVRVSVGSRRAVVRVEALHRTFRGAISFRFRYKPVIADAGLMSMTLAPGLGLVEWSQESFAGPVYYELKSARIGNRRF